MWCLLYPMGKNPWYTLKQKVIKNIQNIPLTFINYFSLHSTGRVQDRKELVILQANTKDVLYIHVTVHRNRFPFNSQPDALIIQIYSVIKLYMFQASSLPSSGVLHCTFGTGKFHAGFGDRFQAVPS